MPPRGPSSLFSPARAVLAATLVLTVASQGLLAGGVKESVSLATPAWPSIGLASEPAGPLSKNSANLGGPTSAYLKHEHESNQIHLEAWNGARLSGASGVGWLAYAGWDSSFYVAATPSSLDVISNFSCGFCNGPDSVIPVGGDPFGVAVDPATREVFVTNGESNNVSVINGTSQLPVGSVAVQTDPEGLAFDPTDNALFVTNNGSDNVSVIDVATLSVVATIAVGTAPAGAAWDSASDRIFVTNRASDNVSVISGSTDQVVASVPVGSDPFGLTDDNATGRLYVANQGSNNVSVVAADPAAVYATIPVATRYYPQTQLEDVAYDYLHEIVWVTAGLDVIVLDARTNSAVDEVAFDPSGIAFDPVDDEICETNSVNRSSGCFAYGTTSTFGSLNPEPAVNFSEQGLPPGANWNVTIGSGSDAVTQATSTTSLTFGVDAGWVADNGCPCGYTYPYVAELGVVGSTPQTFQGNVTNYTQGSEHDSVHLTFAGTGEYGVRFNETALPPGLNWGVNLSGSFHWMRSGNDVGFVAVNGTYEFSIPRIAGYAPKPNSGVVTVNGSAAQVNVSWSPSPLYSLTFNESGLSLLDNWSVSVLGSTRSAAANNSIIFEEPNGSYKFSVEPVAGYLEAPGSGSLQVAGTSYVITAVFLREPNFVVTFAETGLPVGRTWSVNLSGVLESTDVESAAVSNLSFSEPDGHYVYEIFGPFGFVAEPNTGVLTVNGSSALIEITFSGIPPMTYDVEFTESGLTAGTNWSVELASATKASSGASIAFSEPNGLYSFVVYSPLGFSSNPSRGSISVNETAVTQALALSALPTPLSANLSYQIQSASCLTNGGVTNSVVLGAEAEGGTSPYSYNWTLPTGRATGALTSTTTTYGQNNTVTLAVTDSVGTSASRSVRVPMQLPPCPPPPLKSAPTTALSPDGWVIVGLSVALVTMAAITVWLGLRLRRGG